MGGVFFVDFCFFFPSAGVLPAGGWIRGAPRPTDGLLPPLPPLARRRSRRQGGKQNKKPKPQVSEKRVFVLRNAGVCRAAAAGGGWGKRRPPTKPRPQKPPRPHPHRHSPSSALCLLAGSAGQTPGKPSSQARTTAPLTQDRHKPHVFYPPPHCRAELFHHHLLRSFYIPH